VTQLQETPLSTPRDFFGVFLVVLHGFGTRFNFFHVEF